MTSMGPYTTKESCGVECTPKASKVGVTIWVAKKETAKEVKKIFVANLSANGMYRKKVTFVGGKKILIEGKAGAVIGKNNFYYRVSSYPFRQDGSVLSGEVKKENSNINNHNVITMNYGAGSTIDSKTFFAPESPPHYTQDKLTEWVITIPPQGMSNYNSGNYSLDIFQLVEE